MCFTTNGDIVQNQRIIYNKIKEIEFRQLEILSVLNKVLSKLDKGE